MGFVSDMFGMSGNSGLQYRGTGADILQPTTLDQTGAAYGNAQSGINQQQNFVNALMAQNGIQNQSNVYNQLQGVANGTGPNPAQAMLNQQTGQNIASQAALMAGQRGAGANSGLMARQIGNMGAGVQQNAVGQGATMQANQSLNALGAMGNMAGQQVNQASNALGAYNTAAQNEQNQLLGSLGNYNSQKVAMQSNINDVNAGIAKENAGRQNQLFGGVQAAFGNGMALMGAKGGMVPHMAGGGMTASNPFSQAPSLGSFQIAAPAADQPQSFFGNYIKPIATPASGPRSSGGGGGMSSQPVYEGTKSMGQGMIKGIKGMFGSGAGDAAADASSSVASDFGPDMLSAFAYKGGVIHKDNGGYIEGQDVALPEGGSNADMSGGGGGGDKKADMLSTAVKLAPMLLAMLSKGGAIDGGAVPGKAKVRGDSLKNDIVPAMLSPGEVVIPRHVMQSKDPVGNSAKFVAAIMAKNGMRK